MTNATAPTVDNSPAGFQKRIAEAETLAASLLAQFKDMVATAGANMSEDDQLALPEKVRLARANVSNLKSTFASVMAAETEKQLESLVAPLAKSIDDAAMRITDLHSKLDGRPVTFTITPVTVAAVEAAEAVAASGDTPAVAAVVAQAERRMLKISFRVASKPGAVKPATTASTPSENGTGSKGSNRYVADGVEYETRAYVEKFAADAIAAGKVAWTGDPTDSVGLSHRADVLAEKLGHSKRKA